MNHELFKSAPVRRNSQSTQQLFGLASQLSTLAKITSTIEDEGVNIDDELLRTTSHSTKEALDKATAVIRTFDQTIASIRLEKERIKHDAEWLLRQKATDTDDLMKATGPKNACYNCGCNGHKKFTVQHNKLKKDYEDQMIKLRKTTDDEVQRYKSIIESLEKVSNIQRVEIT